MSLTSRLAAMLAICTLVGVGGLAQPKPASSSASSKDSAALREPTMWLAWHAPYGERRASSNLDVRCDPPASDTLWLSVDPGGHAGSMVFFDAKLVFRAAPEATLLPYWSFGDAKANPDNLHAEYLGAGWPTKAPFLNPGYGSVLCRTAGGIGTLNLVYAMPADSGSVVRSGTRYVLGRVIFPAPRDREACKDPVCVQVGEMRIGFAGDSLAIPAGPGGARSVGWAAAHGSPCGPDPIPPASGKSGH